MKTNLTATLSENSFKEVARYVEQYRKSLNRGTDKAVLELTKAMYNSVLAYCSQVGIENHLDSVRWEYDPLTNTGKVFSNDEVIIFNEMGTGIVGSSNPHPNPSPQFSGWQYDINSHGEKGWVYPKEDGTYGWTKGLPARSMFYNAFQDIRPLVVETINVEIHKTTGNLY